MKLFPAFLLFLVLLPGIAKAGDETLINEGLQENEGGVYTLPAGTYTIEDQIQVPEGTTFQGEVGENGELLSKIFLADNSNFGHQVPLVALESNTKVLYLDFDGNSENQDNVPVKKGKRTGNGYHNFIGAQNEKNIEVAYNNFFNNNGDGFRINRCKNVSFHDNTASKGGHDVFYQLRSEGITAYNNTIETRVNSALRAMDCSHLRWYNNVIITNGEKGNGLGMQIQHDGEPMEDLEVCNNVIISSYGPGLWLVGKTSGGEELWLHHNLFLNCGYNPDIYWVSGIVASGYDNARIENNVFDGSYLSAVTFWDYSKGSWSSEATAYLNANIFTDSKKGIQSGKGGFGVNNEISKQTVISSNNCYWGNDADTKGCSVSDSDIFVDPKTHETPSGWWWTGSEWECDQVKPSEMGEIENIYDGAPDLTDEELEEFEFDSIFDVLEMDFSTSGRTEQTADDIKYEVKETTSGLIAGYVKIIGFRDVVTIDNVSYIPDESAVMVKYKAVKSPDLDGWTGRIKKINKDLDIKIENGTAYAVLEVKTDWYTIKENKITGVREKSKTKTSKATFEDSCQAPEILHRPTKEKGYINEYRSNSTPNTRVYVPSEGLTKIVFEYSGNTSEHVFMLGERQKDEKGIISTNYTTVDYWDGPLSYLDNSLIIYGHFDKDKLKVTCFTPYESFEVTDFKHTVYDVQRDTWTKPLIAFLLRFFLMLFCGYKLMRVIIPP